MDTREIDADLPMEQINRLQSLNRETQYISGFRIANIAGSITASIGLVMAVRHNLLNTEEALITSGIGIIVNLYLTNKLRLYSNLVEADIAAIENEIVNNTPERDRLLLDAELNSRGLRVEGLAREPLTPEQERSRKLRRWITDTVAAVAQVLSNAIP